MIEGRQDVRSEGNEASFTALRRAFAWCATLRTTHVSCALPPLALKSASVRPLFTAAYS